MEGLKEQSAAEISTHPYPLIFSARRNAENIGEGLAWIDHEQGEMLTHADLWRQTQIIRRRLQAEGLSQGDIICFLLTRSGSFLPLLMACIELGIILAPIKPEPHEVKVDVRALRPRLVLCAADSSLDSSDIPKKVNVRSVKELLLNGSLAEDRRAVSESDGSNLKERPCLLIKTSGTTGQSKYVELSEKNLAWDSHYLLARYACSPHDRFFCTLPWYHMNAIMMTGCLSMMAGAATEYRNITRSQDPIQTILDSDATIASLTPTLLSFLMKKQSPGKTLKLLRFAFCGAAPLSETLWKKAEEVLQCSIYQGYGLTETTCWIASTPPAAAKTYDNVGTLLGGELLIDSETEFQIVTQTNKMTTELRKLGEIQVRGSLVMCGYRYPDGQRKSGLTPDGRFNTGDIGYIDDNGYVRIVGRKKEIIIRSGINIVPESIYSVVRAHPAVLDCKTVGLPDELLGERAITACILKPGTGPSKLDIRRFAAETLAGQHLPDDFVFVAELPRTEVGKIAIGELRKIVGGDYAHQAFNAINTWKFKRAQPTEPQRIVQAFQRSILLSRPLAFVSYWGVGLKDTVSNVDRDALQRLKEFIDTACVMPRLSVTLDLILTDVHALLNGKPESRVEKYLSEMTQLSVSFGFRSIRLSELWAKAGMTFDNISQWGAAKTLPEVIATLKLPVKLVARLTNSAKRHVEQDDPEKGLKRYLLACHTEREPIAKMYADAVFLTYNDPSLTVLTPPLPTISLSSYRRGTGEKPWFADDEYLKIPREDKE